MDLTGNKSFRSRGEERGREREQKSEEIDDGDDDDGAEPAMGRRGRVHIGAEGFFLSLSLSRFLFY